MYYNPSRPIKSVELNTIVICALLVGSMICICAEFSLVESELCLLGLIVVENCSWGTIMNLP